MRRSFGDIRIEPQKPLAGSSGRKMRRPQFPFLLQQKPFTLQPCMIAPVLPGESLKNANVNIRVLSEPIRNAVTGWWYEFYLFYVRLADLDDADALRDAIIDPDKPLNLTDAVNYPCFHANANYPSWVKRCMDVVARQNFQSETAAAPTRFGLPGVRVTGDSWMNSIRYGAGLGNYDDMDDGAWEEKWTEYQKMRRAKLTVNTFAEYLAKSGVAVPPQLQEAEAEYRKPELLRFVRDFVQPQQVIEPTTGLPAAVVQWNVAERADKRRFFDQPGFICGYVVTRPKVFLKNHRTSVSDILLNNAVGWMPVEYESDPHTAVAGFDTDTIGGAVEAGPLHVAGEVYALDRRDAFLYGEQFVNFRMDSIPGADSVPGAWNIVDLPSSTGADNEPVDLVPSEAEVNGLFVNATRQYVRADGIVTLNIASRISSDATA